MVHSLWSEGNQLFKAAVKGTLDSIPGFPSNDCGMAMWRRLRKSLRESSKREEYDSDVHLGVLTCIGQGLTGRRSNV